MSAGHFCCNDKLNILGSFSTICGERPDLPGYGEELKSNPLAGGRLVVFFNSPASCQPIRISTIDSPKSFALALILFAGIRFRAIPPWILVIAGGVAGALVL